MTLLLKDPDAVLDYAVNWGAEYLGDDQLATSEWSVEPVEAGGVTVEASSFGATMSAVKAAGGTPGRIYRLVNRVVMGSGRIDSRSIAVRVEER